jgi:dUTP pyrophosphatase
MFSAPAASGQVKPEYAVQVARLDPAAKLPKRATPHSVGLDVYSLEAGTLEPGEAVLMRTGIAVAPPPGTYIQLAPRSGLASKHRVTVDAGVIDPDYRGELMVLLCNNHRSHPYQVSSGDRIAQMIVLPFVPYVPVGVAELSSTERGASGFGSSGV